MPLPACRHPLPGYCLACTDTAMAKQARADLRLVLHASAALPDRTTQIRTHLRQAEARSRHIQAQLGRTVPTGLVTDRPLQPPYPNRLATDPGATDTPLALPAFDRLTPGECGSYRAMISRLAGMPASQINAVLSASPWTTAERKGVAGDVVLEQRDRQRARGR